LVCLFLRLVQILAALGRALPGGFDLFHQLAALSN